MTAREQPAAFRYSTTKDGRVRISWVGSPGGAVTTVAGTAAARLIDALEAAGTDAERVQRLLARATGNFKRGNERRPGGQHPIHDK